MLVSVISQELNTCSSSQGDMVWGQVTTYIGIFMYASAYVCICTDLVMQIS